MTLSADDRSGNIVISTWPYRQDDRFRSVMQASGIDVISMPVIEIRFLPFDMPRDVESYDWLVFTSKNGVHSFFHQMGLVRNPRIAVIGESTAKALKSENLEPFFTGGGKSGSEFAEELVKVIGKGQNVLVVLGNLAPDTLQNILETDNRIDRVNVYETRAAQHVDPHVPELIRNDDYGLIAVSSPSAVKRLHQLVEEVAGDLRIVSIGATTSAAARSLGMEPVATSPVQTYEGLAETVLENLNS